MRHQKNNATRVSMSLATIAFALSATVLAACSSQSNGVAGSSDSGHIVNGKEATSDDIALGGSAQSVVYIIRRVGPTTRALCTGTLIKPNVVLTAGHCAPNGTNPATMAVISHFLSDEKSTPETVQIAKVQSIATHPNFQNEHYSDDLALLLLDRPMLAPIAALPSADAALPEQLLAIGYGQSNDLHNVTQAQTGSGTLRYLPYNADGKVLTEGVFAGMIQAQPKTSSVCHGDSGGPLFGVASDKSTNTIFGITESGRATYQDDLAYKIVKALDQPDRDLAETFYFLNHPELHDCLGGPNNFVDVRSHLDWINGQLFRFKMNSL